MELRLLMTGAGPVPKM